MLLKGMKFFTDIWDDKPAKGIIDYYFNVIQASDQELQDWEGGEADTIPSVDDGDERLNKEYAQYGGLSALQNEDGMFENKDEENVVCQEYLRMNEEYKDEDDVANPDYLDISEEELKDSLEEPDDAVARGTHFKTSEVLFLYFMYQKLP